MWVYVRACVYTFLLTHLLPSLCSATAAAVNPKLRFLHVQTCLNKQWERFIEPKTTKATLSSTNSLVEKWAKQTNAEKIKLNAMKWTRPKQMDRWEQNKEEWGKASIPTVTDGSYYATRRKAKKHALPDEVRNRPKSATGKTTSNKSPKRQRPQSAAAARTRTDKKSNKKTDREQAKRPARPQSASAKIPSPTRNDGPITILPPSPATNYAILQSMLQAIARFEPASNPNVRKFLLTSLQTTIAAVNEIGGRGPGMERAARPKNEVRQARAVRPFAD